MVFHSQREESEIVALRLVVGLMVPISLLVIQTSQDETEEPTLHYYLQGPSKNGQHL